jgi:hypothetical protein
MRFMTIKSLVAFRVYGGELVSVSPDLAGPQPQATSGRDKRNTTLVLTPATLFCRDGAVFPI